MATVESGRVKLHPVVDLIGESLGSLTTEILLNAPQCWSRDLASALAYVRALENGYNHREGCDCPRDV